MSIPCRRSWRRSGVGLSIIELMIGITISMFILAGATLLMTSQLGDNRRLLLEAQIQQDLRTVGDIVARDLRRAGYWAQSYCHVWPATACARTTNPYADLTAANNNTVSYSRSLNEVGNVIGTDDNTVTDNEVSGFRWNAAAGTIDVQIGRNNWQALTDPAVLQITQFSLQPNVREVDVPCGAQCPAVGPKGCPLKLQARSFDLVIVGVAVHDATVQRALSDTIQLRNDLVHEVCP